MDIKARIEEIDNALTDNFGPSSTWRDMLSIAEEMGEFIGSYNKSSGNSRNTISKEEMENEWADLIITVMLTGFRLYGTDKCQDIIDRKQMIIFQRGWRNHDNNEHKNNP